MRPEDLDNVKASLAALATKGSYTAEMIDLADEHYPLSAMERFRLNLMLSNGSMVLSMGTCRLHENITGDVSRVTTQIYHPDFYMMDDWSEDWEATLETLDRLEDRVMFQECLWYNLAVPVGDQVNISFCSFYH